MTKNKVSVNVTYDHDNVMNSEDSLEVGGISNPNFTLTTKD